MKLPHVVGPPGMPHPEGIPSQKRRHEIELQKVCDDFGQGMASTGCFLGGLDKPQKKPSLQSCNSPLGSRLNSVVSRKEEERY